MPTAALVPAGWAVLVTAWSLVGAEPSVSRLLGVVLLAGMPAVVWWPAPRPVRVGLAAATGVLLGVGALTGVASGASAGLAVGGLSLWAGIALARSAPDLAVRRVGSGVALASVLLLVAAANVPTGARVVALVAGLLVGARVARTLRAGADLPARHGPGPLAVRVVVAGVALVSVVRSVVAVDTAVIEQVRTVRRALSLVLPSGPDVIGAGALTWSGASLVSAVLPTLLPLVGGAVALLVARRGTSVTLPAPSSRAAGPTWGRTDEGAASSAAPAPSAPSPTLVGLLAAGVLATMLLDLVGIEWGERVVEATGGRLLWPDRRIETVLWGASAAWAGRRLRPRRDPVATSVAVVVGLVMLTVLFGEWRVDGVALRPDLLAVPFAAAGLVRLAGRGVRPIAVAMSAVGGVVLAVGLVLAVGDVGPAVTGPRTFVPGTSALLAGGGRIRGLLPAATMLGSVAAVTVLAAWLPLMMFPVERDRRVRALAWGAVVLGLASILLAEAKTVFVALPAAVVAAAVAPRLVRRWQIDRWGAGRLAAVGAGAGALVVVAPFVGAAVLDPAALRPSLWRRLVVVLSPREWLVGLGAQPLRWDRAFPNRAALPWPAPHAHNEALELLLITGVSGLVLMVAVVGVLVVVAAQTMDVARGWTAAAVTTLVVSGTTTPNLTYFPYQVALVTLTALLVGLARRPALVRLEEDPAVLPDLLVRTWAEGDAVVVAPPDGQLSAAVERAIGAAVPLPSGTALVVPTSGSTGAARAVVLSHAALAASTAASLRALGCTRGQRWALALPLRHVAGLQVLARARALGTDAYVVADSGDPLAIAAAADHAEHVALVPTQLVRCLDAGHDVVASLARFRSVLVGGGPLDPARAVEARAAGVRLVQSYGMTETCGGCVYDGRPFDDVEVDVEAGAGRIRLRGPMLATGLLDPSGDGVVPLTHNTDGTDEGWFVTDDVGRVVPTEAGPLLEVLGRADTMIVSGGVKVDPLAVEALLRAQLSVADAVVGGVPDAEWGERVVAIVAPADPAVPPTLEQIRAAVAATLPSSHAPRELRIVAAIARDGMGKVSATERARLLAG